MSHSAATTPSQVLPLPVFVEVLEPRCLLSGTPLDATPPVLFKVSIGNTAEGSWPAYIYADDSKRAPASSAGSLTSSVDFSTSPEPLVSGGASMTATWSDGVFEAAFDMTHQLAAAEFAGTWHLPQMTLDVQVFAPLNDLLDWEVRTSDQGALTFASPNAIDIDNNPAFRAANKERVNERMEEPVFINGKEYGRLGYPTDYDYHSRGRFQMQGLWNEFGPVTPKFEDGHARIRIEVRNLTPKLAVSGNWAFGTIDEAKESTVTFTNTGAPDTSVTVAITDPPIHPLPRGQIFGLVEAGDRTFTLAGGESRDVELVAMVDSATAFGKHAEIIEFRATGARDPGGAIEASATVPKPTAETLPFGFYQNNGFREILPKFKITRALENLSIRLRNAGEPEGTGQPLYSEYHHPSDVREAIARGQVPTYALPLNGRGGSYVIEVSGDARKVDGTTERVYATWDLSITQNATLGAATETVIGFDRPGLNFEPEDVLKAILSKGKDIPAPVAEGTLIRLGITLKATGTLLRFDGPVEAGVRREHQLLRRVEASFNAIDGYSVTPVSIYQLVHSFGTELTSLQGTVRLRSGDAVDWQDDAYLPGTMRKEYFHEFGEPRWLLPGQTLEFSAKAWTSVYQPRLPSPSGDVLTALPVGGGFSSRPELDGPQITFGGGAAGQRLPWRPGVKRVR